MKKFNWEELNDKTVVELRELCRKYQINGMSKVRKDEVIEAILEYYNQEDDYSPDAAPEGSEDKVPYINAKLHSFLQDNNSYQTLISVSCGAASSNYPVVGRTVGFVKSTYREILNIDISASSVVNGDSVPDSYVLKGGDTLEFVRQAGSKG
jgi:transcription termination factor Rho